MHTSIAVHLLKRYLSYLLLIGIVCQLFGNSLIVAGFEVNKNYISQNLCVNKNQPKKCCHGKCFLKKKLAAEDSRQNNTNQNIKETISISFFNNIPEIDFVNPFFEVKYYTHYFFTVPDFTKPAIFHPPLV
jgi:hypothetical protein